MAIPEILINTTEEISLLLDSISKWNKIPSLPGPDISALPTTPIEREVDLKSLNRLLYEAPHLIKSINIHSDEVLIGLMKDIPELFPYIQSPSERIISEALNLDGHFIRLIKNPTHSQSLIAINCTPDSIKYLNTPNEVQQIEAVKRDATILKHIKNPVPDLLHKAGWIICKRDSGLKPDQLPDYINLMLEKLPNYSDHPTYGTIYIGLNDKMKNDLITCGYTYTDYDDSIRADIGGGYQLLTLEKDGIMRFTQETCAVEGGSVNYYLQEVQVNKQNCSVNPHKLAENKAVRKKTRLHK